MTNISKKYLMAIGLMGLAALGAGCIRGDSSTEIKKGFTVVPTSTVGADIKPPETVVVSPEFPGSEKIVIPSDWKEYKDEHLGISFRYAPYMKVEGGEKNTSEGFELLLTRNPESVCQEAILFGFRTDTNAAFRRSQQSFGQEYFEDLEQLNPVPPNPVDTIYTHKVPYASWVLFTGKDYKYYSLSGDATLNCFRPYSETDMAVVKDYKTVLKSLEITMAR